MAPGGPKRPKRGCDAAWPALLLALLPWTLFGGGAGCLSSRPPPPTELCPGPVHKTVLANGASDAYLLDYPATVVDARGVDWVGQARHAVELEGPLGGCLQGGRMTGTWDIASTWETFHLTAAVSVRTEASPVRVHAGHFQNYGDGVSIEFYVNCPNGAFDPWLRVRANHFEDIHDDAIESDGLCSVEIADNLIERTFVAFAFRNRSVEPNRTGHINLVTIEGNLVRLHAFPQNWNGITVHGGFWKWAHGGQGPKVTVRNNLFLAMDAPRGELFPYVNRVQSCKDNRLLFAGTEAEWTQALAGGCDDDGDDGLCDGERLLALASCYEVITKPDSQSEADFLAAHWDPHVAAWKASHLADDE